MKVKCIKCIRPIGNSSGLLVEGQIYTVAANGILTGKPSYILNEVRNPNTPDGSFLTSRFVIVESDPPKTDPPEIDWFALNKDFST